MDKPSLAYKIILEESGQFEAHTLNYGEEKRGALTYIFCDRRFRKKILLLCRGIRSTQEADMQKALTLAVVPMVEKAEKSNEGDTI